MSRSDFVSVTIVTYNSGRFIKRCLESVLEQKYPNMEVIVIDNASTDGTVDILEQFADRCRIYYNDENIGFAAAQNQAIALSSGGMGSDAESRRPAAAEFHPGAGGRGQRGSKGRHGVRQAAHHRATFDLPEEAIGGFHRHLFHADAAASGPRQPGSRTTATT